MKRKVKVWTKGEIEKKESYDRRLYKFLFFGLTPPLSFFVFLLWIIPTIEEGGSSPMTFICAFAGMMIFFIIFFFSMKISFKFFRMNKYRE